MKTKTESKHTETPWEVDGMEVWAKTKQGRIRIADVGGSYGYKTKDGIIEEIKANAALIVRAVNTHDELLEAVKNLASLADSLVNGDGNDKIGEWERALYAAQNAIRKAERGESHV